MLFQTTQAHEELRAKIRAFAEEEVKPIAFSLDQANEFPADAVKKLGEMGLMGIPYPKEYGGAGLDAISYAIAVEASFSPPTCPWAPGPSSPSAPRNRSRSTWCPWPRVRSWAPSA